MVSETFFYSGEGFIRRGKIIIEDMVNVPAKM